MSIASIPDRLRDEFLEGETTAQRLWNRELADVKSILFWKGAVGEFMGCMILVVFAVGMGLKKEGDPDPPLLQLAIGAGFLLAFLITALAAISGGHVNPAITLGFLITGKITFFKCVVYVLFQCAGGIAGAGLLKGMVPDSMVGNLGVLEPPKHVSTGEAIGAEVMITFLLLFATLAMLDPDRSDLQGSTPLMVGLIVAVNVLFGANISGGCMNPVRSLGPAVLQSEMHNVWIYWVGPLVGGVAGALCYDFIFAIHPMGLRRLFKVPEKAYPKKLEKRPEKPVAKYIEKSYHKNGQNRHDKIYRRPGKEEEGGDLLPTLYIHPNPIRSKDHESKI